MEDRYFAFISYASADRPVADALLAALEQRGLACWMAPRNINPSTDYGEQILQGIRDSSVLVLVFSEHSNNSKYCQREVERAVHYGRRIFPIRIDSSVPNGPMEFHLSVVQWLEAQGESNWEKVAEQLAKAFEHTNTSTKSGAMPTINGIKPYQFGGKECYSAEQLTAALSENWDEGVKNFGRGFVSEWVKVDLRNFDLASRLLDIHENKELDPNEKLSAALVEMNPKMPGMWRGNVVNGEWASRAVEEFQELLQSRIRPRLEKLNGWPDDLVKQLAEVKSEKLSPKDLVAIERMVLSGDGRLILNGREVDEELLQGDPALGAELLNGKLPKLCAKYGDPRRWKQWMSRWAIVKDLEAQQIAVLYPAVISEKRGPKVGNRLLTIDWLEANLEEGRRLLSKVDFCQAHSALTGEEWLMEAGQRWRGAVRATGKQAEWLWSWACTTKPELKQEGAALTQQQLASNAIEGVLLLEGPLPGFWAEKTGDTWLSEAAERWQQTASANSMHRQHFLWDWVCDGKSDLKDAHGKSYREYCTTLPDFLGLAAKGNIAEFWAEATGQTWLLESVERWRRMRKEVPDAAELVPEWLHRWALTEEKVEERLALEWFQNPADRADRVALLEGPLPKFWQQETGETWLAEAAAHWVDLWPQVDALGCGTSKSAALPWIIGPAAALQERAEQLLQQYTGAKDERLDRLWSMDSLGMAECVVLCTAIENELLTPKAKILSDGQAYLKGFFVEAEWGVEADWEVAMQLITANDWNAVQKPWQAMLCDVEMNKRFKRNPKLRAVLESAQPEYLDVVAVCAIYGPTTRELLRDRRRFEMQQEEDQKQQEEDQKQQEEKKRQQEEKKRQREEMQKQREEEKKNELDIVRRNRMKVVRRNRIITVVVVVFTIGIISLLLKVVRRNRIITVVVVVFTIGIISLLWFFKKREAVMMQERRNAASAAFAKAADEMVAPANERRLQWTGAAMHRTGFSEATIARALTRGGTVVAWGDNDKGQATVPAGLSGVVGIAAGGSHTVALKANGTVVAWGDNDKGQATVPAGLSGVVGIAAGFSHTVALKANGTVMAWGNNNNGQTTVHAGLYGVVGIAAGYSHTVALKSDGTVVEWENSNQGNATVLAELRDVAAFAAGYSHAVALKSDGTVVEWENSNRGKTTVPAGLYGVLGVAAGFSHTVVLKANGTVVAWGDNDKGQATVPAGLSGVVGIAAGFSHTVALKSDGTVVAWGDNRNGQATVPAGLSGVVGIAAGGSYTVALKLE